MNVSARSVPRILIVNLIMLMLALMLYCPDSKAQGPLPYLAWATAGYPGDIPDISGPVINVKEVGAVGDGSTDDAAVIQAAINSAPNPAVIFFPAGTYRIESRLTLKSGIVLRGEGYQSTHLECLETDGCLRMAGSITGSFVNIQGGLAKDSTQIIVSDAAGFTVGQGGEIQQEDIVPASASWGEYSVGQMVKIVAITGNTLTINPPLHLAYSSSKNPQIRPIRYVEQVGIEDLHLKRLDSGYTPDGQDGSNVDVQRAADCWIRRVESDNTEKYHVSVSESLHFEIRDSYIHDSESKGDNGEGYGVSLGRHVTSVLVENNIFSELRHAMIIQLGTNGSVFGYNFARRNYSNDGWDKSYISLHGHYPFLNLFEGNIVGWAYMGDYWGAIGPDNTLFRNRVIGTDRHMDFGSYRGIALTYFHGPQYVVGNEVAGNDGIYFPAGTSFPGSVGDPDDVLVHGNNVLGTVAWDPAIPDHTLPASYYLPLKPGFFETMDWPPMGPDKPFGQGTIPALVRWQAGDYIPSPPTLNLRGTPADQAIHLVWTVNTTLPATSTWHIDYYTQTVTMPFSTTGIISPTRAYTLSDHIVNYEWYTVTLYAMLDSQPFLTDTVRVMPTDLFVYLPILLK